MTLKDELNRQAVKRIDKKEYKYCDCTSNDIDIIKKDGKYFCGNCNKYIIVIATIK